MDKYKSKLIFNKYIVKEVNFKYNEKFKEKPVDILFDVDKKTNYINEKNMIIDLSVHIFEEEDKYPFYMNVTIRGFFTVENNEENINFEPNAIAILYPYIRTIVATYTANANIMPLTLPIINVNAMLKDRESKREDF